MKKTTTIEEFESWLKEPESNHIEFKSASAEYSPKKLYDYCAALANEGGGKLILGVTDSKQVVGTKAFQGTHQTLDHDLFKVLKVRVDVEEFFYQNKRVLIFHAPSKALGQIIHSSGNYKRPMRVGASLVEMDDRTINKILSETQPDFSANPVGNFHISDIDPVAFGNLRKLWAEHQKRPEYQDADLQKVISAFGLETNDQLNMACLILIGKKEKIDAMLSCAEIIFEWRQTAHQTSHSFRKEWREPFLSIHEDVWNTIDARNQRYPLQDGLFQRDIFAFDQKSIREALLNAVTHRDYTIQSRSIFVRANPSEFRIESPGGFPNGVTVANVLECSEWRNRRLAECFQKLGLIERSGQGMDDIFERSVRDGKGKPDLSKTDAFTVDLRIPTQVQDPSFILFLEKVMSQKQIRLASDEVLELENIRVEQKVANPLYKEKFLKAGLIESIGRGRGTKYCLARAFYESVGQGAHHTRLVGLSRDQIKQLILNHIRSGKPSRRDELLAGFSELKPMDLSNLLQELKKEGCIVFRGSSKAGAWYPS